MPFVKVANLSEVPVGKMKEVELGSIAIALCNNDGNICAIDGTCPHAGGPLASGALHDGVAVCPWHAWGFDTRTGNSDFNSGIAIPVYEVEVRGDEIFVDIC